MSLPEPASARARWRVVIVDDSPDDRAIVRQLLLQGSPRLYEFVEAATVQAVRATPEGLSVCMILDYKLPDSDAPEVLAALFGPGEIGVCPVVVITGYDSAETGRAAIRAGAQDFVGKAWMTAESLTRATENAMERWTMARELWATEARLQLALAASNTGIWTWDLTTDRVTWSAECHGIYGVPEGSFDGTHAGFLGLVHPHDRASVRSAAQTAIEGGDHYRLEFRVIRPDGEVRWVRSQGRAEYGADGRPERMHGTVTDISERKRAELALEARERELQSLADNSPDIIARFDRELRHVFINAAVERATGRASAEFLGKTNRELGMPEALCDQWDAAFRSVFETGRPCSVAFDFETPEGTHHHESRLVAERGADGEVERVLSVAHDVTDRTRAERALQAALHEAERCTLCSTSRSSSSGRSGEPWRSGTSRRRRRATTRCWRSSSSTPRSRFACAG